PRSANFMQAIFRKQETAQANAPAGRLAAQDTANTDCALRRYGPKSQEIRDETRTSVIIRDKFAHPGDGAVRTCTGMNGIAPRAKLPVSAALHVEARIEIPGMARLVQAGTDQLATACNQYESPLRFDLHSRNVCNGQALVGLALVKSELLLRRARRHREHLARHAGGDPDDHPLLDPNLIPPIIAKPKIRRALRFKAGAIIDQRRTDRNHRPDPLVRDLHKREGRHDGLRRRKRQQHKSHRRQGGDQAEHLGRITLFGLETAQWQPVMARAVLLPIESLFSQVQKP
ncbi:MAG: hypothetical protein ACOVKV_16230, partial [Novosphingobium sp.]